MKRLFFLALAMGFGTHAFADNSYFQDHRVETPKGPIYDFSKAAEGSACAVHQKAHFHTNENKDFYWDFVLGIKANEKISLKDYSFNYTHDRDVHRDGESHHTYYPIVLGINPIHRVGVSPNCSLILEGGGRFEVALPTVTGKKWAGPVAHDSLNDANGEKMDLAGIVETATCVCNERTTDPSADRSNKQDQLLNAIEISKSDLKITTGLAKTSFGNAYQAITNAVKAFEDVWKEKQAEVLEGTKYTDLNHPVEYKAARAFLNQLNLKYASVCPGDLYDRELGKVSDEAARVRASVQSTRIPFAKLQNQIKPFRDSWEPVMKDVSAFEKTEDALRDQIGLITKRCELWAAASEAVATRFRLEKTQGKKKEFAELADAILKEIEAQAKALRRYNASLYWNFLLQRDISALNNAQQGWRYGETFEKGKQLGKTYAKIKGSWVPANNDFDEKQKLEILAQMDSRVKTALAVWTRAQSEGISKFVNARSQLVVNSRTMVEIKAQLQKLDAEHAAARYVELLDIFKAGNFLIEDGCDTFASAVSKRLCWEPLPPEEEADAELNEDVMSQADKAMDNVQTYLENLKKQANH